MKQKDVFLIGGILLFFMVIAFALRAIPFLFVGNTGFLHIFDTDTYYNIRQIEVMVHNFPQYNWFDPMTAFPDGKSIDWGPLFPFIAAILCLITGAATPNAIASAAGWVSPLMAMLMVPVAYLLGKILWNNKAGLVAAGLISILSFQYFSTSSYGWVDHHITEVLFSSLFFLAYGYTLSTTQSLQLNLKNKKAFFGLIALSVITGILFFLALLSSTTVILTLIVIAVYTAIQGVVSQITNRTADNLFALNLIFLTVSAILFTLFGIRTGGSSVIQYSMGIVYVHVALIAETVVLWGIAAFFEKKIKEYLITLTGFCIAGVIATQMYPPFAVLREQAMGLFFVSADYAVGIMETQPLDIPLAFQNFNVSLILMAGGFLVLAYTVFKKQSPMALFLLVWSVIMLVLTIQFQRFQYFLTVNVVLLAGICIIEPFEWRDAGLEYYVTLGRSWFATRNKKPENEEVRQPTKHSQKSGKSHGLKRSSRNQEENSDLLIDLCVTGVVILTACLVVISVSQDIEYGMSTPTHTISPDWTESLNWLPTHTPETGIDYYQQYDATNFSYPAKSYGIIATSDAGHWITFFSHRIPITNPFQNNLNGPKGAAAFFLSQKETQADEVLETLGGKYVITNSDIAVDTFTNLVPWQSGTTDISPYISWFVVPDKGNPSNLLKVHRYTNGYFQTQVVRLYSFDGSLTYPDTTDYIRYEIRQVPAPGETAGDVHGFARVITRERPVDPSTSQNDTPIVPEGTELLPTGYANMFSDSPQKPIQKVPALTHYRLIHESPDNASVKVFPESEPITLPGIKQVKIFEFVKGAHIRGNGIIEVPIITNTNRTFVYRQESENGEFVVPYSTVNTSSEVHATGPYHIVGTTQTIDVMEDDVLNGREVVR
jgi:dolichyl-diphosphooligosaccharide--protein glycosyltransferase